MAIDRRRLRPAAGDGRTRSNASAPTGCAPPRSRTTGPTTDDGTRRRTAATTLGVRRRRRVGGRGAAQARPADLRAGAATGSTSTPSDARVPRRPRHQPQAGARDGHDHDQGRSIPTTRSPSSNDVLGFERGRADGAALGTARASRNGSRRAPGVPADPALTARGREQARAARRLARARADRRDRVAARCGARVETAAPIARAHGLEVEIVDGLVEYDVAIRPLHPDGGAARDEDDRAGRRWSKAAGRSSAASTPDVFRDRVARRVDDDRRRASRANASSRCATAASINVALAVVLGIDRPPLVRPGLHVARRAWSRRAPASARSRSLNELAHLDATREDDDRHDARCTSSTTAASRSSPSTGPRRATRSTARPRPLLADAFRAFDADDDARRRGPHRRGRHVLRGRRPQGGRRRAAATRCTDDGDGPMGPTRMLLVEAGDRRGRGLRGRGRARARAVVRPARRRARRGVRRVLPPLGRAADRRRHGPPAAPHRPLARARPHPHRPRRLAATRRCAWASPTASTEPGDALAARGRRSRTSSPRCRSAACATTGCRATSSGARRSTTRCASSYRHAHGDARVRRSARRRDPLRGGRGPPRRVRRRRPRLARRTARRPRSPRMPDSHSRHQRERTVADIMSRAGRHRAAGRDRRRRRARACASGRSARSSSSTHDDRAIGILTERDLIRLAAAGSDASTAKVSEWMTADPDTVGPDVEARAAFAQPRRARLPPHPGRRRRTSSSASCRCATSCASR